MWEASPLADGLAEALGSGIAERARLLHRGGGWDAIAEGARLPQVVGAAWEASPLADGFVEGLGFGIAERARLLQLGFEKGRPLTEFGLD